MVVLTDAPVRANWSFDLPLEAAGPFWVFDYVCASNKRKDYEESQRIYERELNVPYSLVFHPDGQDLTLYLHYGGRYGKVKPNARGRYEIPELELELGLLEGWVRYWYRGELLLLPAEVQQSIAAALHQAAEFDRQTEWYKLEAEVYEVEAEVYKLVAEESKRQTGKSDRRTVEADRRAEELQRRLDAAKKELAKLRASLPNP
jgi:hypothetical protein